MNNSVPASARIGYSPDQAIDAFGPVETLCDALYEKMPGRAVAAPIHGGVRLRFDRPVTTLGAIFAGGAARRFGRDKAAAAWNGQALLDHVASRLRPQCDALVVVGRSWPGLRRVDDRPAPGLGPLGALAGALVHAQASGFTDVLTSGCDLPDLPTNLRNTLLPSPAVIRGQPLLGLWPAALAERLLDHLAGTDDRSMRGWIMASGAKTIVFDRVIANINRVDDLDALKRRKD